MNNHSTLRLKSSVEICSIDTKIYFFVRPGIAVEMKDPSKFIATTCKLMDGKNNLHQLKQILTPLFPKETPYLENLLMTLDNEYLLEDVSQKHSNNLTNYDITRWSRNIEFFNTYCKTENNKYSYQEKLKSTKVVIFGLGGVGSNVLYNLAAMKNRLY